MKFNSIAIATFATLVTCYAADITDLTSKITALSTSVTKLNNDLQKFDSKSGYFDALKIDVDASNTKGTINDCTTSSDMLDSFTDDNTDAILNQLKGVEVTVRAATQRLADVAPRFKALGVAGIAKNDVASLKSATNTFAISIARRTPDDKLEEAAELLGLYGDDFKIAAAPYA